MSSRPSGMAALRHSSFRMFWLASAVSNIGTWMQTITVPFVVYETTGSTGWLSATVAASYLPQFFVSPLAGAIADRVSRRRILLVAQGVQLAAAVALAVMWAHQVDAVALVLAVVIASNVGAGFHIICWQATVPALVPKEDVPSAVRLNSMQHQLGRALGPAVAGLVLARFGPGTAFTVNAVSFLGVVAVLLRLRIVQPLLATRDRSVRADLRLGLRYVIGHEVARQAVICAALLAGLAQALVQMAPALARDGFDAGEGGYAALLGANGAGALIATAGMALVGDRLRRSRVTVAGLLLAAAGALVVGVLPILLVGAAGFFLIGFGQSLLSVSQNTALLLQVDDTFRGRVISIYIMANIGTVPLGGIVFGAVAGPFGIGVVPLVAGGTLAVTAAVAIHRYQWFAKLDATGPPATGSPEGRGGPLGGTPAADGPDGTARPASWTTGPPSPT